jgi:hypothetical protein
MKIIASSYAEYQSEKIKTEQELEDEKLDA